MHSYSGATKSAWVESIYGTVKGARRKKARADGEGAKEGCGGPDTRDIAEPTYKTSHLTFKPP